MAISSAPEPSQPLPLSSAVQPVALSSVSAPSQPLSTSNFPEFDDLFLQPVSLISVSSTFLLEYDSLFNSASSGDNASAQLPTVQPITIQARSTSGIIMPPFYAKRKRLLSIPHHVVRNNCTSNIARPTDELIESFSDKRRRIDNVYVCTVFSPATDAPT